MAFPSLGSLFRPSQIFAVRGGVHPEPRKHLTAEAEVLDMPVPPLVRVPLQQHSGAMAEPLVRRDDIVLKGQLIGQARGAMSANIHAPSSGRVIAVGHFTAPHPSNLPIPTITIRTDGQDRWGPRLPRLRPEDADPDEIAAQIERAGIVGLGGAAFPAAVKLNQRRKYALDTLLLNGAECEPYLTCDDRLMREHAEGLVDGAGIMARALGVSRIVIAVEANKPEAIAALRRFRHALGIALTVAVVPTQYPMGSAKHLVLAVTGKETPARARTAELGVLVYNVGTAHAVHLAVRYGEPLISRIVTVSGRAITRPANVRVLIGTPVADVIAFCGGLAEAADRVLLGGPMMGLPIQNLRVPVVKGTCGILALSAAETRASAQMPCIRCGSCVQACPCGLTPFEMNARIHAGDLEGAVKVGLMDCIACGACAFACPSSIPLVQAFDHAKGKLAETQSRRHQQEETRRLAAARQAREAAIAEAKRQAMARRKVEMAARKVAQTGAAAADPPPAPSAQAAP
ncbi:electron transport complex subunit RsxC [Frigidibacter mobilis]|uniref:Ion-translocating oxidoreductase complex subunit C n=1 Tax=Frigidibacter mobilis TaxID=1335048 RepID=A0A159Z1J4_9RHOB|nr:electron transport complex subunit RsxC [Frigidibacter mobilis]AMY68791.1 4Fe-4S ferredoxin, RnfC [Frigidibacter mobilis]